MVGDTLEDFVAVLHRQLVQVHHVVEGRSLVPGFGERGAPRDDVGEHHNRSGQLARLHQLHALLVERVDGGIARAAPQPPDDCHRGLAQGRVRVEQTRHKRLRVGGGSDVSQTDHGLQAAQGVGVAEGLQRLLAVQRTCGGGGRGGAQGQGQGQGRGTGPAAREGRAREAPGHQICCAGPGAREGRQPRTACHVRTPAVREVFSLAQSAVVPQVEARRRTCHRCGGAMATQAGSLRAVRAGRREAQSARKPAALWLPSQ